MMQLWCAVFLTTFNNISTVYLQTSYTAWRRQPERIQNFVDMRILLILLVSQVQRETRRVFAFCSVDTQTNVPIEPDRPLPHPPRVTSSLQKLHHRMSMVYHYPDEDQQSPNSCEYRRSAVLFGIRVNVETGLGCDSETPVNNCSVKALKSKCTFRRLDPDEKWTVFTNRYNPRNRIQPHRCVH